LTSGGRPARRSSPGADGNLELADCHPRELTNVVREPDLAADGEPAPEENAAAETGRADFAAPGWS
jgi:hypothetical protein